MNEPQWHDAVWNKQAQQKNSVWSYLHIESKTIKLRFTGIKSWGVLEFGSGMTAPKAQVLKA
jgi:hypothetical protein